MKTKIRLLSSCLLLTALSTSVALAAAGRMKGIVADGAGQPLSGVTITMMAEGSDYEKKTTTKKTGRFSLTVTDGNRPYTVRVEKEGYRAAVEPFKFEGSDVMDVAWVLFSEEEAAAQADQLQALEAKDKATKAYNEGAAAYNADDQDAAIGHFTAAVEANAQFDLAFAALARLYLEKEQYPEARQAAESFLAIRPDDSVGLQMLYDSYWGAGDTEKANEILSKLIAQGSSKGVAARIFNQAVAAIKAQKVDAAEKGFAKALAIDPELHQARLPLAQIYFAQEKWQDAIDMAEGYLEKDAVNGRANIVRYESYLELGDQAAADAAFAAISQNSPKAAAEVFLRDGTNFYNNGEIADATQAVETSMKLDGTNPQAYYQLGLCYASSGKNGDAKANLEKFLEMAPEHPEAASVRDMLTYLK